MEYYNLTKYENTVKMKWNNTLKNLTNIFTNVNSKITKIDFPDGILLKSNIAAI